MPDSTDLSITWQHWRIDRHNPMRKKWLGASQKNHEGSKLFWGAVQRALQHHLGHSLWVTRSSTRQKGWKGRPCVQELYQNTHKSFSTEEVKCFCLDLQEREMEWIVLLCYWSMWITAENMNYYTGSDQKSHLAQQPQAAMSTHE